MNGTAFEVRPLEGGGRVTTVTCAVPAEELSAADITALSCVALTNVVGLGLPFHCTTEQGTKELPGTLSVTASVNAGEPRGILVGDIELMAGEGRLVIGVVIVNGTVFEGPEAFDTEIAAVPGNAASWGKIEAVSRPELFGSNVVVRGEPFQFTTDALSKFEPATESVNPFGLQYGVAGSDVVDAESEAIVGVAPGVGPIVKFTTLDTSVVVVAPVPEEPETAEPGI